MVYPINSVESSKRIGTLVSEWKAGIVPLRQHYIPLDEKSYIATSTDYIGAYALYNED